MTKDGLTQLFLPSKETAAALSAHPPGERLVRGGAPAGCRVPLAEKLNALVRASWFRRAPKRPAASLGTAEAAVGEPGGELPAGLGKPAVRALHGTGLRTLEQMAERSAAELLALHGAGRKAARVLPEALRERGPACGSEPFRGSPGERGLRPRPGVTRLTW
ncbi:hypothetical protein ACFU3E_22220 [Streptomyces sp. NPDC057424]|uniref:hypothetical protein n=1 Tax=Streptomyces sp. NPDC057424 TaxID=3346127 RepID=UPI003699C222